MIGDEPVGTGPGPATPVGASADSDDEADGGAAETGLDELVDLKNDLVALISQELRNPLTGIRGYSQMLIGERAGPLTDTQRKMVTAIDLCAYRLHTIIEDILVLSSIDSSIFGLMVRPADLQGIIERIRERIGGTLDATGVVLVVDLAPELPSLCVDSRQIERALINIVENAIKFSAQGGTVTLSAAQYDEEVRVSVRDEGIGIPSDEQHQLFNRFFRASTANELEGTGLGLAVVKAIVERHGGSVRVVSDRNQGTVVTVSLPVAAENSPTGAEVGHVPTVGNTATVGDTATAGIRTG